MVRFEKRSFIGMKRLGMGKRELKIKRFVD